MTPVLTRQVGVAQDSAFPVSSPLRQNFQMVCAPQ